MKNPVLLLPHKLRWLLAILTSGAVVSSVFGFIGLLMDGAMRFVNNNPTAPSFYVYMMLLIGFCYGVLMMSLKGEGDFIVRILKTLEETIEK